MIMAPLNARIGVPEIAGDTRADRHRLAGLDQGGCLLDVQFKVSRNASRIEVTAARPQCLGIAAALRNVFRERAASVDPAHVQGTVRQRAERAAAADIGYLEPDAFFRADAHDDEIIGKRKTSVLQRSDGDEASDHASRAVEISTMRY